VVRHVVEGRLESPFGEDLRRGPQDTLTVPLGILPQGRAPDTG